MFTRKTPSNDRTWDPDMAALSRATFNGDEVTLSNVRDTTYGSPGSLYKVTVADRSYDLAKLTRLWFIVESFSSLQAIAHTFFSFEFVDGEVLAVSVEARREQGETYSIIKGLQREFELMYLFGTERDFVLRRTHCLGHDVYLYPVKLPPEKVRSLLLDVLREANHLAEQPRFYNSITDNCTTTLFEHLEKVVPGAFPALLPAKVLPGLSDKALYRRGFIDTALPFEALRERYNVRAAAGRCRDEPDFSRCIRSGFAAANLSTRRVGCEQVLDRQRRRPRAVVGG